MMARRYALLLLGLGAVLLVSCVVSLGFGPARVPVDVVWHIVLHKLFGIGGVNWSAGQEHIVWLIRVPRMLLGALVGLALAVLVIVLYARAFAIPDPRREDYAYRDGDRDQLPTPPEPAWMKTFCPF